MHVWSIYAPENLLNERNAVWELVEMVERGRGVTISTKNTVEFVLSLLHGVRVEQASDKEPQDGSRSIVRTSLERGASNYMKDKTSLQSLKAHIP